jgi:Glucose / Sorbosone dehydrogenase
LRDDGSGQATWIDRHVEDLNKPYGLAWRDNHVLVADQDGIWSVPPHNLGALRAGSSETKRVDQVPPEEQPSNASMRTAPIKQRLPPARAIRQHSHSIRRAATFMRWCKSATVLVTSCHPIISSASNKGGFYGWPYAYIGQHPQPGFAERAPDKVKATITPDLLFEAHSSVLDLVFYEGDQFPSEFKGDAFVALKGSWNRSEPTGYKVVRVPFKDGKPQGYYENFATGFWVSGEQRAEVWARPAARS